MAYAGEAHVYEVLSEMASREMQGRVRVLGVKYSLPRDKEAMENDIRSRIWCTYRKNFRPISGTNLTGDSGWGCTLRCGQMLLAQTLLCRHIGREFRWTPDYNQPKYFRILRKFLDVRDSEYSIQMVALQGADFGRPVGQWFGPNNVAQAIKKLAAHDSESELAVHVAMDMLVVIDDLKATACEPHSLPTSPVNVTDENGDEIGLRSRSQTEQVTPVSTPPSAGDLRNHSSSFNVSEDHHTGPSSSLRGGVACPDPPANFSPFSKKSLPTVAKNEATSTGVSCGVGRPDLGVASTQLVMGGDESMDFMKFSFCASSHMPPVGRGTGGLQEQGGRPSNFGRPQGGKFRPVLLFIPLRLGQESFNQTYAESLKSCLTLPQSVGFIGGKPRHALYFIGYYKNDLLFLDPHTTQPTVQVKEEGPIPDYSYHTSTFGRMDIAGLDPSIALGFFCKDEDDVDDLVKRLRKGPFINTLYKGQVELSLEEVANIWQSQVVLKDSTLNMFELTQHRPAYWGPYESSSVHSSIREPFILVKGADSDDEDFEIIDWPPVTTPPHVDPAPLSATPPRSPEYIGQIGSINSPVHH